jgi:hypothetical protein
VPSELERWVFDHVALTGRLELVHERPWATVWRGRRRDGSVWLKVCAPVQAFEPRLTQTLASRWPSLLPEVLARDEERGWLLLGDAGARLGFGVGPEPWLSVLPAYAELQRAEARHAADHLNAAVPDRRLERFPTLFEAMLARELPLSDEDRARLRAFAPQFIGLCDELSAAGQFETVQHDDLHGNNVYVRDGACKILDWGDSCVSHAFLTLYVTFLHLTEREHLPQDDPWFARLRDAYLEPWGRPSELREIFGLALRIGPFAHAFVELRVFDALAHSRPEFEIDLAAVLARCVAMT